MSADKSSPPPAWSFAELSSFDGEPRLYWPRLCEYARTRLGAEGFSFLVEGREAGAELQVLAQAPAGAARRIVLAGFVPQIREVRGAALTQFPGGFAACALAGGDGPQVWGVVETSGKPADPAVAKEIISLAELYLARRREQRTQERFLNLTEVMDLGLALGESRYFGEAALRICNAVGAQLGAARASLGWAEGVALRLQATSHGGKVAHNSQEALAIVKVMEEAMDQNNEVAHPALDGSPAITRETRQFSSAHDAEHVLSVPFRVEDQVVGVLCVERAAEDGPWETASVSRLRLLADLAAPRLEDLYRQSGWFGKRLWRSVRRRSARWLGPEYTGWKLAGVTTLLTLLALSLIQIDHQVKAPFVLKTDAAARISAPFPGYIDEVSFHLGDAVKQGDLLVGLDRKELLLEEADTVAAASKNSREGRSYMAEGKLAQMQVAFADQATAETKLAIIRHRLDLTQVKAPFDGVVVEGELRERLAAPVQAGEPLLKIVQLRDLYGQLQVDERDIPYLAAGLVGQLSFASRPDEKYSVSLDRFEPVAEARAEGTTFALRVGLHGEPQSWWRPGMSGVCKMTAGKRSVLWVLGHRLVEALRLWLWV